MLDVTKIQLIDDLRSSPQAPKTSLNIAEEVAVTMEEARLYGIELDKGQVKENLEVAGERASASNSFGRIAFSLPPKLFTVAEAIAAANKLNPNKLTYVETNSLLRLADEANSRQCAGIRLLPFATNGYGRDPLGHFCYEHQDTQISMFEKAKAKFEAANPGFELELATVQEIISAWIRHLLKHEGGDQVYDKGWYRTTIFVPGGDASRRLFVVSDGGRLGLGWCEDLVANACDSLALSAGEKI